MGQKIKRILHTLLPTFAAVIIGVILNISEPFIFEDYYLDVLLATMLLLLPFLLLYSIRGFEREQNSLKKLTSFERQKREDALPPEKDDAIIEEPSLSLEKPIVIESCDDLLPEEIQARPGDVDLPLGKIRAKADNNVAVKTILDETSEQLSRYYDINITHINSIYSTATIVLIVGFTLIIISFLYSIFSRSISNLPSIIGSVTGVITEVVGAVLLGYYKVAIKQANKFIPNFHRFTTVASALQILDGLQNDINDLSEVQQEELFKTRLKIVRSFSKSMQGKSKNKTKMQINT